ncbi:glutathione S-transferase N-terminal domain-containing protein [Tropicimonas sp. S265A]|uniref:glutathione S-transferase N-terminal domain-containing protein n=1 Tax=Tropicimonas sp. S265A TaxID=3415134 RepID=UPI003C7E606E
MIDLYYWKTSNGHKVTLALEEMGLDYTVHPIDLGKDEQHAPEFVAINPNAKIPAIIDHDPAFGTDPLPVIETGAILLYLAEKTAKFLPSDPRARLDVLQWFFWQAAGVGPNFGQLHHYNRVAPPEASYGRARFAKETQRLYGVLDTRLTGRTYVCEDYSIADMMLLPWVNRFEWQKIDLKDFPEVKRWRDMLFERPAVQRAFAVPERLGI